MELLKIQIVLLHISTVLSTGEFVRLVNGSRPNQGRVEIYHHGQWGTICEDGFGDDEARAVCRALGYRDGSPFTSAHFGRGTGHIFVDNLQCSSTYNTVNILMLGTTRCTFRSWGVSDCGHSEDAGVECESEHVRLVNGITPNQGRIEIYHNGEWGTICNNNFGNDEARAVCRALGYRDGIPFRRAHFGRGTGNIFVDNLNCYLLHSSSYQPLQLGRTECSFRGWGVSYCNHGDDAGVACKGSLVCGEGHFGYSCGSRCHCKESGCNSLTGACYSGDCLPGWMGTSCSVACPSRTFGQSCTSICHCKSSGCDPVTGVCTHQTNGCLDGWRGVTCDQEENKSSTAGYKVAIWLLAVLLALAVFLIIGVYVKFKRMKKQNNHSTTENATRRTNGNRGLFAIALPRQGGLRDIAHIGRGNVAFHGAQVDIHFGEFARNQRNNNRI